MRWIKHLTCAHSDEALVSLLEDCGLEGYGFYWLLLETVAGTMDKSDRCDLTYSVKQWSRVLYCHHHRVVVLMGNLQGKGLVTCEKVGDKLRVSIPNLLKYRDEYSKRSGHSTDKVRMSVSSDSSPELELEQEAQAEAQAEPPQAPTGAVRVCFGGTANRIPEKGIPPLPAKDEPQWTPDECTAILKAIGWKGIKHVTDEQLAFFDSLRDRMFSTDAMECGLDSLYWIARRIEWFDAFWSVYWRKVSKKEARSAFFESVTTPELYDAVMSAVERQTPEMSHREPDKVPHAATWIHKRRWEDETPVSDATNGESGLWSLVH